MPAKNLKIRKLRASEVTFTVEVEPEHIPMRGNCMASGDPDFDRECEEEIIEALNRGETEAWCCIVVKATWEGIEGFASLGGCSFMAGTHQPVDAQITECIDEHGMREEALEHLNQEVERKALQCQERIRKLKVVAKPRKR